MVVLATKIFVDTNDPPSGLFHVFEVMWTKILFSNPTTFLKLPHNPPCTFLGWTGFLPDEFWPYGEQVQRQVLMAEQRGRRMGTEEETVVEGKQFGEAEAVMGTLFRTTEVYSSR